MQETSFIASMLPMFLVSIPFAIGNYYLAKSLKRSAPVWVILTLIPIINVMFYFYVLYVVVLHIIHRLQQIVSALNVSVDETSE